MKDNQSEQGMGEQIMDALSDALQGGNFNELNRLVSQSVTNVLNEVGKHIPYIDCSEAQRQAQQSGAQTHDHTGEQARQAQEQARRQAEEQARQAQEQARRQAEEQTRQAQEQARRQTQGQAFRQAQEQARGRMRNQTRHQEKAFRQEKARRQARQMYQNENPAQWQTAPAAPPQLNNTALLPFHFKKVGSVSNVLYQVFGGIGLGFTLIFTLFHLIHVAVEGTASLAGWGINFLFLAIFADMIRLGIGQRKRLKLAERYAGLCGRNLYSEIEYLARSTGRKTRRVIKDLQKMMKIGMFPEGHLDEKRTCFMLSDGIYQQYLETENNRRMREAGSRKSCRTHRIYQSRMPDRNQNFRSRKQN
ncbi:MAG: cell envelope integrity protein TolA [Lachnospiraceae bacterium]|nr:cell envelope integrity protein TolA [Lachnospiraceae bacterium]